MYWAGDWEAGPTRLLYVFQQILGSKLLEDFPRLRVGFLEAGSEWAGVSSGDCASQGAKLFRLSKWRFLARIPFGSISDFARMSRTSLASRKYREDTIG